MFRNVQRTGKSKKTEELPPVIQPAAVVKTGSFKAPSPTLPGTAKRLAKPQKTKRF